jgi:hypothetical protein
VTRCQCECDTLPDSNAIIRAAKVITWAKARALEIEVDADAGGGIDITLRADDRQAWIALMNGDVDTVVRAVGDSTVGSAMLNSQDEAQLDALLPFVRGETTL